MAKNYSKLGKDDLLKVIEKLESRKKYGLIWDEEKTKEQFEKESENALPVLKEVKGKEIKTDAGKPTNILIEGDNYHSLSVLNYTHQGKIDVIYIDPPYNTGNKDFVYNDNYVDREDVYRHSKWLSFMSKRLHLAKNLLKEEGVILVSIDSIELAQLKLLMNEIFGEENFINIITWKKTNSPKAQANTLGNQHEYVIFYAKNISNINLNKFAGALTENYKKSFNHDDDNGKGPYQTVALVAGGTQRNAKRKSFEFHGVTDQWLYKKETLEQFWKDGRIYKTKGGQYRLKKYLSETEGRLLSDLWVDEEIKPLQGGSDEYVNFLSQKPISLLKRIIKLYPSKNAVVLDFFAGSGTTGVATALVNDDDAGNRKFILCTYNKENANGKIIDEYLYPRLKKAKAGVKYFKTSFVKNSISRDDLKIRITRECTEMLCLREGIFDEVKAKPDYHIFEQNGRIMAVYYALEQDGLEQLKKEMDKMKGEKILYCFTFDPLGLDKNDFADWQGVSLEPIPQKILDIYEQIYEY